MHGLQKAVTPPQPSACGPQVVAEKAAQVSGVQAPPSGRPHRLRTPPPPQVSGSAHGLQNSVAPPQPSPCSPHVVEEKFAQVSGVQAPPSGATHTL